MTRSLQILKPKLPQALVARGRNGADAMFWWALVAVLLQFIFPYVVLDTMGLDATKLREHPATFLVIICGLYALVRGIVPLHQRCRESPGMMLFVFIVPVLNIYSAYFTGISGAALYAESYWSPAMLALMLATAHPEQKRLLGKILITLCVMNVFVALIESVTANNWFPVVIDPDAKLTDVETDFRANAFYNHPLSASLMTAMAVFLLFGMRLRMIYSAPIYLLFLVGLLAFGGRTALFVTLAFSVLTAGWLMLRGILRRNLKLEFVVVMAGAAIVIPLVIAFIVTQTSIADRIIDTLYYDGSAQARTTQFEIFRHLSLRNWLFGISHDDLDVLKYQIGLGGKETDIENFWILMLLNLGLIGFSVFLASFAAFLLYLGRMSRSMYGWLLVVAAVIIDSGSNSLGAKSADLFCEVAFLTALSGYADYVPSARTIRVGGRKSKLALGRPQGALDKIVSRPARGLRTLTSRVH